MTATGLPGPEPATTAGRLQELQQATGKTEDEVIADAVCRLYETVFGHASAQDPQDDEDLSHVLFRKLESNRPASILLRQGADMSFVLEEPFRYVGPDHDPAGSATVEWIVPRREMTDLASVPEQLTWLVPRYGRHTLPALLHDYLQRDSAVEPPNAALPACDDVTDTAPVKPTVSSETADTIFRDGMRSTGVPLVRRWLMWAAVSVRTIFNEGSDAGPASKVALLLWKGLLALCIAELALAGLLGLPWLVLQLAPAYAHLVEAPVLGAVLRAMEAVGDAALSVLTGPPVLVVAAALLLGPLLLGVAFGRRYRVGVLAGYSLLFVSFPLFFVVLAGGVYRLAEAVAKLGQSDPNPVHTDTFRSQAADGGPGPEAGAGA